MTDVAKLQISIDSTPALKAAQNLAALDKAAKRVVEQAKNLKEAKLGKSATTGGAEFKNLTKPVNEAADTIEQYVGKLKTTAGSIAGLKTDLQTVAGDFGKVVESINKVGDLGKDDRFKTLQEQLKPLGIELRQLVRPLKANAKFFKSIKDNTKGLTKRIGNIATKFANLRESTAFSARNLRKVNESAEKAAGTFDKLRTSVGQTTSEVNRLDGESKKAASAQDKLVRGVNKTGIASLRASNFVRQLATGLGLVSGGFALAQGARNFVSTLADFEFQAAKTSAVAVKLSSNLKQVAEDQRALIDQARDLGASTRFTAVEAAEAQFFLARAGFDVKEVLAATPATLDLAAAGYLDLGRAADIASNALQQFQLETSQLGDVTDALVFTANNANTSVEQLAQALNYAGPFAASLGVTVNEAAGAIGALGNAGIQGSLAGTNFRGILVSLLSPSREAGEELDKLGKRLKGFGDRRAFDVTNQGIEKVIINLREATKNSEDASAEFAKVFNRRNVSGALALSRNIESFSDLLKGLDSDLGTAERVRKFVDDTLVGALQRARSAAAELALALGEGGVGEGLRNFVDDLAKALRVLSGGENAIANTTERSLKFAAAIKGTTAALGALITTGAAFAGARFATLFISALVAGSLRLNAFRKELALTNIKLELAKLKGVKAAAVLKGVGAAAKTTSLSLTSLSVTNPAFAFAVAGAAAVAYSTDLFGLFNKSVEAADGQRELADATRAAKKELELFVSQEVRVDNLSDRLSRIAGILRTEGGGSPQALITEVTELLKGIRQVGAEASAGEIDSLASTFRRLFEDIEDGDDTAGKARQGLQLLGAELRATGREGVALADSLEQAFEQSRSGLSLSETKPLELDVEAFLTTAFGEIDFRNFGGRDKAFDPSKSAYDDLTAKLKAGLEQQARDAGVQITEEFQEATTELVASIIGSGDEQGKRIEDALTERDKAFNGIRQATPKLIPTEGLRDFIETLAGNVLGGEVKLRGALSIGPDIAETGTEAGVAATAFRLLQEEAEKLDLFNTVDPTRVEGSFRPLLETLSQVEVFLKRNVADETRSQQLRLKDAEKLAAVIDLRREQERLLKEEEAVRQRLSGLQGPALAAEKARIDLLKEVAAIEERPLILEFDSENFTKDISRLSRQIFVDIKPNEETGEGGAFSKLFERAREAASDFRKASAEEFSKDDLTKIVVKVLPDESSTRRLFEVARQVKEAFKQATPQVLTDATERLIAERQIREETAKRNAALAEERKNVDAIVNRLQARKQENDNNLDTLRAEVQFQKAIADAKDRQALIDAQIQRETDKLDFSDQFDTQGKLIDNENLVRARELLDPILKELDLQRQEQRALKLVVDTVQETDAIGQELVQLELLKDANADLTAEEEARRLLSLANVSELTSGFDQFVSVLTASIGQQREFNEALNQSDRDKTLSDIAEENRLLGLRIKQGGTLTALQQAEAQATASKLRFSKEEIRTLAALIEQNREYKAALEDLATAEEQLKSVRSNEFGDYIRSYQEQTEATLIQAGVIRDLTVEEEALRIARDNNFSSDTLPRIRQEVAARRNATEALQDFNEKVRIAQAEQRALDQAQASLSKSLTDVIVNAKDAEEAFKGFVKQIIAAIAQAKIFALLGKSGLFDKDGLLGAPILEGVNTSVAKVDIEEEFRQAATGEPLSGLPTVGTKTVQVSELIVNPAPKVVERKVIENVVGGDGSPITSDETPLDFEADPGSLKASVEGLSLPAATVPMELEADPGSLQATVEGLTEALEVQPDVKLPDTAGLERSIQTQFDNLGIDVDPNFDFDAIPLPDIDPLPIKLEADTTNFQPLGGDGRGDLGFPGLNFEDSRFTGSEFAQQPFQVPVDVIPEVSAADLPELELPVKPGPLIPTLPSQLDDGVGGLLNDEPVIAARLALKDRAELDLAGPLESLAPELESLAPEVKLTPTLDREEYLNNLYEITGGNLGQPAELELPVTPVPSGAVLPELDFPEAPEIPLTPTIDADAVSALELPELAVQLAPTATELAPLAQEGTSGLIGEASEGAALSTGASTAATVLTTAGSTTAAAISTGAATAATALSTGGGGTATAIITGAGTAATALGTGGATAAAAMIQGATTAAAILAKASAAGGAAGAAAGGGGGFLSSFLSLFGIPAPSYKGNVFTDGTIDRQYYSGGVPFLDQLPDVGSQPASFLGQDGSLNSLREGGSQEAILPLGRDGQGRLGVRMVGGSTGSSSNVTNNNSTTVQNFNLQASTDTFGMTTRQRERKMARFSRKG